MSTKEKTKQDGELSEQQLDKVAGGQEVRKMETIIVTAKRPEKVVKMETIVVTASRDKPDLAGTRLAQADTKSTVAQGFIERSNVNAVTEMSRMIEINRMYTNMATLLQQQHDLHKSAIDKLADVPA